MQKSKIQRRGLLRSILRYAIAVGAAAGGVVLHKRNGSPLTENVCADPKGRIGCGTCGLLIACGRPRGLSFKQSRKDIKHDR